MEFVSEGCFELTGYPPVDVIGSRKVAYGQLIHPADRAGVMSLMIIPLISGDEPLAAISIANKSTGTFGPDDERVLMMLASSAVIGLENARLYQVEYERKQQLQTLCVAECDPGASRTWGFVAAPGARPDPG
jgi:GAF domain-containing protein